MPILIPFLGVPFHLTNEESFCRLIVSITAIGKEAHSIHECAVFTFIVSIATVTKVRIAIRANLRRILIRSSSKLISLYDLMDQIQSHSHSKRILVLMTH